MKKFVKNPFRDSFFTMVLEVGLAWSERSDNDAIIFEHFCAKQKNDAP